MSEPKDPTIVIKQEKPDTIKRKDPQQKKRPQYMKRKNSEESSDTSYDDGYDSELYGDEADQDRLAGLDELDRESILDERYKKRKKEKEKRKLEREQKMKENAKDKKSAALSELTQKRMSQKSKKDKASTRNLSESESSEEEKQYKKRRGDSDEEYEDRKLGKKRGRSSSSESSSSSPKAKEKKEISRSDLEKIRLSRKSLELLSARDIFAKTVIGCYVRVNVAQAAKQQAQLYVIAKIIDVRDYTKNYKMDERETNKLLVLQYGKKEWPTKMVFVSNSEFEESEFIKWQSTLQKCIIPLPTIKEINEKGEELKKGIDYRYSSEEIQKKVNQRVDEKMKKGEKLTLHELLILEERAKTYELEFFRDGNKNLDLKQKAEQVRQFIKKSRASLNPSNEIPKSKLVDKDYRKMEEEFPQNHGDYEDDENHRDAMDQEYDNHDNELQIQREQSVPSKVLTISELNEELRNEFKKIHNVELSIDHLIDEWEIETAPEKQ